MTDYNVKKGDLVTCDDYNFEGYIFKVISVSKISLFVAMLEIPWHTSNNQQYKHLARSVQLFCDQVSEVEDIGINKVCDTCPRQLACVAMRSNYD